MSYTKGKLKVDKWGNVTTPKGKLLLTGVSLTSGNHIRQKEADDNIKRIVKCWNNYDKIDLLLQQLTPQGSEFANEPERCFEYAKGQIDEGHQAKKDVVKARRKIDGLVEACKWSRTYLKKYKKMGELRADGILTLQYCEDAIAKADELQISEADQAALDDFNESDIRGDVGL